jgi:hypothetical protein
MLSPQAEARTRDAFFDLALASRELYPAWVRVLEEETGVDVGYRRTGLLHCDFDGRPGGKPRGADRMAAGGRARRRRAASDELHPGSPSACRPRFRPPCSTPGRARSTRGG